MLVRGGACARWWCRGHAELKCNVDFSAAICAQNIPTQFQMEHKYVGSMGREGHMFKISEESTVSVSKN
eukprot:1781141-Amphidinium_carterae.1